MLELNAVYLLACVVLVVVVSEWGRVIPILALLLACGVYSVAQGGSPPWNAGEFAIGFGQAIAAGGLALVVAAMIAELGRDRGAQRWLSQRLGGRAKRAGLGGLATLAGLGGHPVAALAVLAPLLRGLGQARTRAALAATALVNAAHGCLVPAPLPIAALAILGADWRLGLAFGLPVFAVSALVGLALAGRAPDSAAETHPGRESAAPPRGRAGIGLILVTVALIGLLIAQSLGQIPSEPLGGGSLRESLLGLGRPMILAWVGIGGALLLLGGLDRRTLGEHGPLARGARQATGVLLAIGAAGGFQMILHNSGMSVVVAERVAALGPLVGPAFGLALPVLIAATSRALQGSPLTAAIAAAGIMQPLLAPLGLAGDEGRALAAIAVGVGAMAVPHVNDGYFWLAGHLAGLRPAQGLKRVTGGALLQAAAALATVLILAALVRP